MENHPSSLLLAAKVFLFFKIALFECKLKCYYLVLIKSFLRGSFGAKHKKNRGKSQYLKKFMHQNIIICYYII
jgi:hypothetical protein